jgi:ABC-type bacteriocin/lantibiotic exporter with double-glycine peptidase domain
MIEPTRISGYPPEEALWRLLRMKGYEGGLQAFKDAHWHGPEPESLVETLASQGIQARAACLQEEDLGFLERPTMVELADASWVLLADSRSPGCPVATPWGCLPLDRLRGRITGRALDLAPGLPPGTSLWLRLKALFLARKRDLGSALAATLMLQGLALGTPAITAIVMNRALPDGATSLLGIALAGLLLATGFQVWIGWIRDRVLLFVATRVETSAERGFLEHALRCPYPFLQGRTLGELMQAFGGFTAARELLPVKTVGVFLNGSMAFVYLGAMLALLPWPTLLILMVTTLLAVLALWIGRLEAALEARQVAAEAQGHGLLIELVAGIATLKGAGAEGRGLTRWQAAYRKVLRLGLARGRINLWATLGLETLGQSLAVVLLIWGGAHLLAGTLKAGTLFAYLQLSAGFTGAVLSVVQTFITLMILKPQLAKAQEILSQEPEPRPRRQTPDPVPVPVVMDNVWFRYSPAGPWILKGYDLRVAAGERQTLAGPSGSGKSTVLRLLAGLHAPEKGTILLGGQEPRAARHNLVYLPQFVQIFGGSMLENLRVFSNGAPLETLMATARHTGLQALVDTLPMGYQTVLPPGGGNFSGGQRQLVALTGALASGRPLLLLDEALANLDPILAEPLQVLMASGNCTVVTANHTPVQERPREP